MRIPTLATLLVGTQLALALGAQSARAGIGVCAFDRGRGSLRRGAAFDGSGQVRRGVPKFKESYTADPAAGTVLNLATCYEKQGKLALAWSWFKTAETVARRAGQTERAQFAHDHAAALEGQLAKLTVTVSSAARVPGLTVTLDSVELGQAAWGIEMPVDPALTVCWPKRPARSRSRSRSRSRAHLAPARGSRSPG